MEVSFIRNKDEARELWAVAAPLLERCVRHSVRGEYSVDDIRAMVEEQAAVVVLVSEDKGAPPVLAVAAEVVPYVSGLVVGNIMALGGWRLRDAYPLFKPLCEYLRRCGCTVVECSCSPAMERFLKQLWPWKESYRVLRLEI